MESLLTKFWQIFTDPSVAIPFWGAVGGAIRMFFSRPSHWVKAMFCLALGAVFAGLFTSPIVEFFNLPTSSAGGVGAVMGILSYETAKGLASFNALAYLINKKD